jgi:hypothetical protein
MDPKMAIAQTIGAVEATIGQLKDDCERLEFEINQHQQLLDYWRREYAKLQAGKGGSGKRLAKGEPLRRVNEYYDSNPRTQQSGLTVKEIEEATGLNWTTARNVVETEKNGFVKAEGNKYRRSVDVEKDKQRRLKIAQ